MPLWLTGRWVVVWYSFMGSSTTQFADRCSGTFADARRDSWTWEAVKKDLPKADSKKSFNGFREVKLETVNQWMTCLRVNWNHFGLMYAAHSFGEANPQWVPWLSWNTWYDHRMETKDLAISSRCSCELPKPCGQGLLDILGARSTKGPLTVNSSFSANFWDDEISNRINRHCWQIQTFLPSYTNQKVQISKATTFFVSRRYVSIDL